MSRHVDVLVHAKDAIPRSDAEYRSCKELGNDLNKRRAIFTHLCHSILITNISEMLANASGDSEDDTGRLKKHQNPAAEQNVVEMMERAALSQTDDVLCDQGCHHQQAEDHCGDHHKRSLIIVAVRKQWSRFCHFNHQAGLEQPP